MSVPLPNPVIDDGPIDENLRTIATAIPSRRAIGSFAAYRNNAASYTTGSVVVFDAEEWDVSSWYDTTTGVFTPTLPGIYRLSATVYANAALAADVYWYVTLRRGGTNWKTGQVGYQRGAGFPVGSSVTGLVTTDGTVGFDVILTHGVGAASAVSPFLANTFFQGELVGRV